MFREIRFSKFILLAVGIIDNDLIKRAYLIS